MTQPALTSRGAISWIVVNTHPQRELFAVESLNTQQFVAYCPMLLKRVRHARRSELVPRAMFPAHVFAGLHAGSQRWRGILSTSGVRSVARSGELLYFLPAGFVEALKGCDIDGSIEAPGSPGNSGQQRTGPSTDYGALITAMVEMSERDRLFALIGLLAPAAGVSGGGATLRHGK